MNESKGYDATVTKKSFVNLSINAGPRCKMIHAK